MQTFTLKRVSLALLTSASLGLIGLSQAYGADAGASKTTAVSADAGADQAKARQERGPGARHRHSHHGHKFGGHHSRRMKDVAMWVPGYGPVGKDILASLSLNDKQQALLKETQESAGKARQGLRDGKTARMKHPLTDGRLDPHSAVKAQEERWAAMQQTRAEHTQRWLAFWDALEPAQQDKVSAHITERAKKRSEIAEKRWKKRQKQQNEGSTQGATQE